MPLPWTSTSSLRIQASAALALGYRNTDSNTSPGIALKRLEPTLIGLSSRILHIPRLANVCLARYGLADVAYLEAAVPDFQALSEALVQAAGAKYWSQFR